MKSIVLIAVQIIIIYTLCLKYWFVKFFVSLFVFLTLKQIFGQTTYESVSRVKHFGFEYMSQ